MWVFGSGFPKSHNHFGLEGYGTALKPAYEPIIMAMKPIEGTFKQNAEKWGQAGINIDGCRVGSSPGYSYPNGKGGSNFFKGLNPEHCPSSTKGRWPANLILDEEAGAMLDQQSGVLKSGREDKGNKTQDGGYGKGYGYIEQICQPSQGGASRFFYCAKTSSRERNEGLNLDPQAGGFKNGSGRGLSKSDPNKEVKYKNNHPTVKPLALMRYLITLISPPTNALILDPFAGSGSTIVAAHQLGIKAIGIEKQSQYCEIARARVAHAKKLKFQDNPQMEMFG
jgi:site-specific DNA-methyltransferase (adenine-specific)